MTRRALLALAMAGTLAGCTAASGSGQIAPATLALADLPRAVTTPPLAEDGLITRIAVGSCNRQDQDQGYWQRIAAANPQLFLMIGDNVYGDIGWDGGADLGTFRAAYASLAAEPGFAALRSSVPMLATWDDHDFGPNDGGGTFTFKRNSQQLFEHFWDSPAEVRGRDGVYHSVTAGPPGRRVQIIMLDTRYFRSDLAEVPQDQRQGRLGRYTPQNDPAATMLGEEQWRWLQQELAEPANLRILVSSIQVLTEAHHFESWANMPRERARLLAMLADRAPSSLVLLSGDRHFAAFYQGALPNGEKVWEMTTSSLNAPLPIASPTTREPDPLRQTPLIGASNFGTIEINWQAGLIGLNVEGTDGIRRSSRRVSF